MKSCQEYQELISRLLDGQLTEDEQCDVERHIDSCPDCAALYAAFCELSLTIVEDLEEPPERLHENIMADVRCEAIRRRQAPKRVRAFLAMAACAALVLLGVTNLPRMGSAPSMMAAATAKEAAVEEAYEESAVAPEEPMEAQSALYAAASASEDSAPAAGDAMDSGAEAARGDADAAVMPFPEPEAEPEAAEPEAIKPEAAEPQAEETPRTSVRLFVLVGLPLIGALVLLLARRRTG